MGFKTFKLLVLFFVSVLSAASIQVNQVGYERVGAKTALFQSDDGSVKADVFKVLNSSGSTVFTGTAASSVTLWKSRSFQVLDFSSVETSGTFTIEASGTTSPKFTIGDNLLFEKTSSSVLGFFDSMKNTDDDHAIPYFYDSSKTHDVYGGWSDATGDRGKYLSHLSYANYFNPQQIPFVVWSLLKSYDLNKSRMGDNSSAERLAAWGADYLLRVLDQQNFFYITVFDGWGWQSRQICAWKGADGIKSAEYQAGMREGAGMSIAALARTARSDIQGDSSSSKYLAAAERAYVHIKANNTGYIDDGKENIIDDYCALIAAVELYQATGNESYRTDADTRVQNIADRQHENGWFWADNAKARPFYHASDEGLPVVALVEYLKIGGSKSDIAKNTISKNVNWYLSNGAQAQNPFSYPRQMHLVGGEAAGTNLALNKTATASQVETSPYNGPASQAFDNDINTRWSSGSPYTDTAWLQVDLGSEYSISKVILNWETACGKEYSIKTSLNGTSWTVASTVTNGAAGIKEISFSPVKARYVRMQGISRSTSYGYSIYEFEVYGEALTTGEITEGYFVPHSNETGYWWQGENARLASISTALQMASMVQDLFDQDTRSSLKKLAQSELDWILGKNPFGICCLYGFGTTTYPSYPSKNGFANYTGGICNGITSDTTDEDAIAWMPYPEGLTYWKNWRWIEQWLPHDAWYLLAIAQQSNIFDNPYPVYNFLSGRNGSKIPAIKIDSRSRTISLSLPGSQSMKNCTAEITDLKGRRITPKTIETNNTTITLSTTGFATGLYFVRVNRSAIWQQFSIGL